MEDERIKIVKQWPESKSVRDIKVFLRFDLPISISNSSKVLIVLLHYLP